MKLSDPHSPRSLAFFILCKIEKEKQRTSSEILSSLLEKHHPDKRDRALITEMVMGVLRHRLFLDHIINGHLRKKRKPSYHLFQILRIGAYQILFLDRIPSHAAVNESVNMAKNLVDEKSGAFVNAILRKIALKGDKGVTWPNREEDLIRFLSIRYSHPAWMVRDLVRLFGSNPAEELLEYNNLPAPLSLRVNLLKTTRSEVIAWIRENHPGVELDEGRYSPQCIRLKKLPLNPGWPPLKRGWVYVQDEAAQMVSLFADPKPGTRIVDYCSAPGGKITHLAELVRNRAELIALDVDAKRLGRVRENCKRLGLHGISVMKILPGIEEKLAKKPAQLVLVDAPCSGMGIIRRHPDLKWKKTKADVQRLSSIQQDILERSCRLVAPGGVLVYSTCTILDQENSNVIRRFLKRHPDFEIDKSLFREEEIWRRFITPEGFLFTFPPQTDTDGFFAARLKKSPHC